MWESVATRKVLGLLVSICKAELAVHFELSKTDLLLEGMCVDVCQCACICIPLEKGQGTDSKPCTSQEQHNIYQLYFACTYVHPFSNEHAKNHRQSSINCAMYL